MSESTSPISEQGTPGLLRREIWPRTVRTAIVSAILPWWRGRSRRRRVEAEIAKFSLPDGLSTLTGRTAMATRLWPEERMDVARELGTHFADGLASGRTAEQLAADFGNPGDAAALIRDAKVRCRPLWWKSFRWVIRGAAILTAFALISYGYLAARYFWGAPVIRVNYTAQYNAPILATPKEQRAWPMYIEAMRELGPQPEWYKEQGLWPASPEDPHWAEAVEYFRAHEHALKLVRKAAAMPTLGYVFSNVSDPEYMKALEARNPTFKYDASLETAQENPALVGVLLPYLGEMRSMARLMKYDAAAAVAAGDRERFMADLEGALNLGDQALRGKFIIDITVGIAIGQLAADMAMQQLEADGAAGGKPLLTGEDERRIAHQFAALGGGRVRIDPESEGRSWEDMLQRLFSDNGSGEGHLIKAAADDFYRDFGVANPTNNKFVKVAMPVVAAMKSSRGEIAAQVKAVVEAMHHDEELPLWRAFERTADAEYEKLYARCIGPLLIAKDLAGNSPYQGIFANRDLLETRRAAVETVCALKQYKRAHGSYPADLEAMVPALLPAIPIDPFNGKPLRYKLAGEGSGATPLLYSVGVDGVDDGGTFSPNPDDKGREANPRLIGAFHDPKAATPVQVKEMERSHGDWMLYPPRIDRVDSGKLKAMQSRPSK